MHATSLSFFLLVLLLRLFGALGLLLLLLLLLLLRLLLGFGWGQCGVGSARAPSAATFSQLPLFMTPILRALLRSCR